MRELGGVLEEKDVILRLQKGDDDDSGRKRERVIKDSDGEDDEVVGEGNSEDEYGWGEEDDVGVMLTEELAAG